MPLINATTAEGHMKTILGSGIKVTEASRAAGAPEAVVAPVFSLDMQPFLTR
jgi:hypothetical protein